MVERYPNLKETVGGSIPGCEISSLLNGKTCQVVNYLFLCSDTDSSTFSLKKKKKPKLVTGESVDLENEPGEVPDFTKTTEMNLRNIPRIL